MKTIVCCGKKQTGKSSAAKFLTGLILYNKGVLSEFSQNSEGDLLIKTDQGWGVLDLYRKDIEFIDWASQVIWPHVKIFSFADELKWIVHRLFNISWEDLNKNKESKIKIKYKQLFRFVPEEFKQDYKYKPNSHVTVRDLLVIFGTYICREIDTNCWIQRTFSDIENSKTEICIIDDCRFENEFAFAKKMNTELLLFKSNDIADKNPAESFEFPKEEFQFILNKSENNLQEKNNKIKEYLLEKGILEVTI